MTNWIGTSEREKMNAEIKYLTREEAALKLLRGETIVWLGRDITKDEPYNLFYRMLFGQLQSRNGSCSTWVATYHFHLPWTHYASQSILTLSDYEKLQAQKKAEEETFFCHKCGKQYKADPCSKYLRVCCNECLEKPKQSKLEKFMEVDCYRHWALCRQDLPKIIEIIKEELGK